MLQSTKLIFSIDLNSDELISIFQQFQTRAIAEGFTVEEHDCIINTQE